MLYQMMHPYRMKVIPSCLTTSSFDGTLLHQEFRAPKPIKINSSGIHHTGLLADMWQDIQGANLWNGLLNPINLLLKEEILRYGDFAQLCYDAFDSKVCMSSYGGCKYNPDEILYSNYNVAGNWQAYYGYRVTKYLYTETDIILGRQTEQSIWIGFMLI